LLFANSRPICNTRRKSVTRRSSKIDWFLYSSKAAVTRRGILSRRFAPNCRALLIAAALVVIAVPAGAAGFRLGAQVIGNHNTFTGDLPDEGSWEGRFGVGAGLIAEFSFTPDVALSFQPAYTPRDGSQVFKNRFGVIGTIEYDLNYISLPLIVRVTGDPVGVRGFVTAGLDLGFFIDDTATTENSSEDISDDYESTTIGALFGAGVMVPVKRHFLTFELRYSQGLDDIVARDGDTTNTETASPSVKYRGFGLLVGFIFTLGGE